MSQPKSAPASAGNAKFLSTAPLRSRSPSRARSPASERPAFEAARDDDASPSARSLARGTRARTS